jgi:hypothetical protein
MNNVALFTTCTAHTGDLARYRAPLSRFPRTRIVSEEILRDEYECGLIRIETALTPAQVAARIEADDDLQGSCQVVAR